MWRGRSRLTWRAGPQVCECVSVWMCMCVCVCVSLCVYVWVCGCGCMHAYICAINVCVVKNY